MRHLLTILLATLCAATSYGQTMKALMFNSTNGQVIAATNVVWTNAFNFSTNTVAAQVRTNLSLGATWLTNTNVTNFQTAIELGKTNSVLFRSVTVQDVTTNSALISFNNGFNGINISSTNGSTGFGFYGDGTLALSGPIIFGSGPISVTNAAITRTNLSLGLPALTNTSNVTMMRALSGSTNTNHPFSGSVSVVGTNNTNTLVFSNGILQSVQ